MKRARFAADNDDESIENREDYDNNENDLFTSMEEDNLRRMKKICISPKLNYVQNGLNFHDSKQYSMDSLSIHHSYDSSNRVFDNGQLAGDLPVICQAAPNYLNNTNYFPAQNNSLPLAIAPPIAPDCWKKEDEVNEEYRIRNCFLGKLHVENMNRRKLKSSNQSLLMPSSSSLNDTSYSSASSNWENNRQLLNQSNSSSSVKSKYQGGSGMLGTR